MFYTSHTRRNRIVIALTLAICTAAIAITQASSHHQAYIASESRAEKAPASSNLDQEEVLIERMESGAE